MSGFQRHTIFELPSYKYIPNRGLHPSRIENVIHIPTLPDDAAEFSIQSWKQSNRYLYAIDLFNLGYYWEVHEVLEKLWLKLGKESAEGVFIQGLIQLSVALLKKIQHNTKGTKRLTEKALPKLFTRSKVFLGINVDLLIEQFEQFIEEEREKPPLILLHLE